MATAVKYEVIDREAEPEPWELMERALADWHEDLTACRIVLLWVHGNKPDADNRLVLGKCHPVTEADRELHGYDRKISLNREAWEVLTEAQRLALVDHELCHIAPQLDEDGEQKEDGHGQKLWRTVKHYIEEFVEIVERHGLYKADLAKFADIALKADPNRHLFEKDGATEAVRRFVATAAGDGIDSVSISSPGREIVVLTAEDGERARRMLRSVR